MTGTVHFKVLSHILLHSQLNSGQFGDEYLGNDLRVEQAWMQGLTGCNVTVTVVDDGSYYYNATIIFPLLNLIVLLGLDFTHRDLKLCKHTPFIVIAYG